MSTFRKLIYFSLSITIIAILTVSVFRKGPPVIQSFKDRETERLGHTG